MTIYIGLDVHSKETVFHCQNESGDSLKTGRVTTSTLGFTRILKDCKAPSGEEILVGLETGGQAEWAAGVLITLGAKPVVIDAKEVRDKARRKRQKTDERDAFEICDGLRREIYVKIVWLPTPQVRRLRDLLTQRRHFVKIRVQTINATKGLLRSKGFSTARLNLRDSWNNWQRMIEDETYAKIREFLEMQATLWLQAHQLVLTLDERLKEAVKPFAEVYELLQTMPGVGPIIAAEFIAAVGDVSRFPSAAHLVSYLGLAPSTYDSGGRERRGGITKEGPAHVRAVFCEGAHQARLLKNPLNPYYRKHVVTKGVKRTVVAVASRMVRILYQMWRKLEAFDERKLNVIKQTRTVTKKFQYQLAT